MAGANLRDGKDSADDGILSGLEVVQGDLRNTDLVVLSACETALGDIRSGEGVAGLRQCFQIAGAQSILATLWRVDDENTAELISQFFNNLSPASARAKRCATPT